MRRSTYMLLAATAALVASLVFGGAATAKPGRQSAGTVIIGHDQEPDMLNPYLTAGNSFTTAIATNPILAGGGIFNQKAELVPYLLDALPKIQRSNPLTITFRYKQSAKWSDGKPVTGADFVATWRTIMNPNWDITSRQGWEDLQTVKARGKSVTMVFRKGKPYFAWDSIAATSPVPAHTVKGQDFNKLWNDSLDISSGPFKFQSWEKGTQVTLVRNNAFTAGQKARLERVIIRYIPSTATMFQALSSGEIDETFPQPQLQIASVQKDSRFVVQSGPGYAWEHMDIQLGPQGHPALKKKYVRQALITGINRAQIRQALYITPGLVKSAKDLPVLQSHIFMPFERYYEKNFGRYRFSQRAVIELLKKNRCTGGPSTPSAGNNAIWSCPEVGKLSFRFTTTSGNQLRALTFEIAQKQLRSVGIELLPRFGPSAQVFGQILPSGDWDIFMFTWLGSPTGSGGSFVTYGCGGDQNYQSYCNKQVSALLSKARYTPDPKARAALLNRAERAMAEDMPSIPIFVRPLFEIFNKRIAGPILNPTQQGPTWNLETWRRVG